MNLKEKLAEAKRLREETNKAFESLKVESVRFVIAPSKNGGVYIKDKSENPQPGLIYNIKEEEARFIINSLEAWFFLGE